MSTSRESQSTLHAEGQRWTNLDGVGQVPTGPRRRPRSMTPDRRSRGRFSPYPTCEDSRKRIRADHQRPDPEEFSHHRQQDPNDPEDGEIHDDTGHTASDSFSLECLHPQQRLNAAFPARQQQLSYEARRIDPPNTHPEAPRRSWNNILVHSDHDGANESNANMTSSAHGRPVKQEPSDETGIPQSLAHVSQTREHSPNFPSESPRSSEYPENRSGTKKMSKRRRKAPAARPRSPDSDRTNVVEGNEGCTCPIGFECGAKKDNEIDCRTLTSGKVWRDWIKMDQKNAVVEMVARYVFSSAGAGMGFLVRH